MSKRNRRSKPSDRQRVTSGEARSGAERRASVGFAEQDERGRLADWDAPAGSDAAAHGDGAEARIEVVESAGGGTALETLKAIVTALASLRLTVVLFVLAMVLIFAGTLAQRHLSNEAAVKEYFYSIVVWMELRDLLFADIPPEYGIYYPGGLIIGGAMLINLLAAHLMRFQISWKRSGILMIHCGMAVLIVGLWATWWMSEEAQMTIPEGGSANFVEDSRSAELAIIDRSDPATDVETVIPEALLDVGERVELEGLPFDVVVEELLPNSQIGPLSEFGPDFENPATAGSGLRQGVRPMPETAGVDPNQLIELPSAYVTLIDRASGEPLGTYLTSVWFTSWLTYRIPSIGDAVPQVVEVDGRTYHLYLRFRRTYKPYTIELVDFQHEVYLGTDTPKNFTSHVRLIDNERGVDRRETIEMNRPLYYGGDTLYQADFLSGDRGTVLQVVRNPGWVLPLVPYKVPIPVVGCLLVGVGLLVHFVLHLVTFLRRSVLR